MSKSLKKPSDVDTKSKVKKNIDGQTKTEMHKNKNKEKKRKTTLLTSFYYDSPTNVDDDGSGNIDYDSYYDFPINSIAPKYTKYPLCYRYPYHYKPPDIYTQNSDNDKKENAYNYGYNPRIKALESYKNSVSRNNLIYFTKNERIMLINGYIQRYLKNKLNVNTLWLRYPDVVNLIELYYNNSIFVWNLNSPYSHNDHRQYIPYSAAIISSPDAWPFNFRLRVHPTSKYNYKYRGYRNDEQENDTFIDLELNFFCSYRGSMPSFVKIYYEFHCDEIEKLNFWKGTIKYRYEEQFGHREDDHLIIPRFYVKTKELMDKKDVNIKLSIKFLCVEWFGDNDYFQDIKMIQNVKHNWFISNNYNILDNFRNKSESILFSKNFDDDNWCLYCKQIKNPTNKKKTKFCIGLMLIKLPWFFNYIKIQLIVKCNGKDNKKRMTKNIWTGFESSLQIPFKYDILKDAETLNITIKFKIIKVFDINDKEVNTKDFVDWN